MSTVSKSPQNVEGRPLKSGDNLRRERITGIVVLVVFAALMALLLWLASLGGVPENVEYDWWMMP